MADGRNLTSWHSNIIWRMSLYAGLPWPHSKQTSCLLSATLTAQLCQFRQLGSSFGHDFGGLQRIKTRHKEKHRRTVKNLTSRRVRYTSTFVPERKSKLACSSFSRSFLSLSPGKVAPKQIADNEPNCHFELLHRKTTEVVARIRPTLEAVI
jgi:hypothetical protein